MARLAVSLMVHGASLINYRNYLRCEWLLIIQHSFTADCFMIIVEQSF